MHSTKSTTNNLHNTVTDLVTSAIGEAPSKIELVPVQGSVNTTFFVDTSEQSFVVRVRFNSTELGQFKRELECAQRIRANHLWTPEVLDIGVRGPHSYSIQRRVPGEVATSVDDPDRLIEIWRRVGEHAKEIHKILVNGYLIDPFCEAPDEARSSWCDWYFDYVGNVNASPLVHGTILSGDEFQAAVEFLLPLKELTFLPTLAHGNLSLSNLVIDANEEVHIIDWGTCQGHMACELDLSELLAFNVPREHVVAYLGGHGLTYDFVEEKYPLLLQLQLGRFLTAAHWLCTEHPDRVVSLLEYAEKIRGILKAGR